MPLVVVGGGQISEDENDLSVEVLDLTQQADCKVTIPGRVNSNDRLQRKAKKCTKYYIIVVLYS